MFQKLVLSFILAGILLSLYMGWSLFTGSRDAINKITERNQKAASLCKVMSLQEVPTGVRVFTSCTHFRGEPISAMIDVSLSGNLLQRFPEIQQNEFQRYFPWGEEPRVFMLNHHQKLVFLGISQNENNYLKLISPNVKESIQFGKNIQRFLRMEKMIERLPPLLVDSKIVIAPKRASSPLSIHILNIDGTHKSSFELPLKYPSRWVNITSTGYLDSQNIYFAATAGNDRTGLFVYDVARKTISKNLVPHGVWREIKDVTKNEHSLFIVGVNAKGCMIAKLDTSWRTVDKFEAIDARMDCDSFHAGALENDKLFMYSGTPLQPRLLIFSKADGPKEIRQSALYRGPESIMDAWDYSGFHATEKGFYVFGRFGLVDGKQLHILKYDLDGIIDQEFLENVGTQFSIQ